MIVWKLFELRKDGVHSLFIDNKHPLPMGKWMNAEHHPTKGFSDKHSGWHCTFTPCAPHLNLRLADGRQRIWAQCEIPDSGYTTYPRPESQGGAWILANRLKIVRLCPEVSGITKDNLKVS